MKNWTYWRNNRNVHNITTYICYELTNLALAQSDQALLNWLSPLEPWKRHSEIRSTRLLGSGTWVTEGNTYMRWSSEQSASQILCCYGSPGAGKTFIAYVSTLKTSLSLANILLYRCLVIDTLEKIRNTMSNIGLAYVYCDYQDRREQTEEHIIGAIVKQLLEQLPTIPEEITEIWMKSGRGKRRPERPELTEVKDALRTTCNSFDRTYICLDALDEFEGYRDLFDFFWNLLRECKSIRLFITCRSHVKDFVWSKYRENVCFVRIEAKDSDIGMLIKERIIDDRKKDSNIMNDKLQKSIIEKVSALAEGMFVLTSSTIKLY